MSANIITCRRYEDGTIAVQVNGKDIPDATVCQLDITESKVYIVCGVGVYNDLNGDEHPVTPPPGRFTFIEAPPKHNAWQRFKSWLQG